MDALIKDQRITIKTQVETTNDQDYYDDIQVISWLLTTITERQAQWIYTLLNGQEYNPCILHQGKDILIHYTTQVVTYWRDYLSKEKFRERYNQSRSSSKDPSTSGKNRGEPLYRDNAQELRHRKMDLMADYYGPEYPGQNPVFRMDKDKEGNRSMIIQIDGEQADALLNNQRRTWG